MRDFLRKEGRFGLLFVVWPLDGARDTFLLFLALIFSFHSKVPIVRGQRESPPFLEFDLINNKDD